MAGGDAPAAPGTGLPRAVEVLAALAGLILSSPLLAAAGLAVAFTSPGPVFFRQRRVGRGGRPFTFYKLRTMRAAPPGGEGGRQITAGGDGRVTAAGRLLRKTKLDELPALWNVLRGEMSLVGPRPEVERYVDRDSPLWRAVLRARPGLTDPMTLRLRNEEDLLAAVDDPETFYRAHLLPYKLRGQAAYLARRTPWSDLVVLASTALAVLLPGRAPAPGPEEIRRLSSGNAGEADRVSRG